MDTLAKNGGGSSFARLARALYELIIASKDNQWVQLAVVSAAGGVVYKLQQVMRMLWRRFQQMFHCNIRLQNREKEVYDAVITFISTQKMVRSSMLLAEKKKEKKSWREQRNAWVRGDRDKPVLELKPDNAQALYTFIYKGRRIAMWRHRGETITTGYNRQPLDQEELTLSCWGRDHSVLQDLMQEAIDTEYNKNRSTDLTIWVRAAQSWLGGWEKAMTKKRRELDTVVLDPVLKDEIVADARKFIDEPEYYANLGIPYRRGYLLYGPPGNGKTSFCQALAGELNLDICMLNLSDSTLDDNALAESLRDAPANAIILIEDIDAAFVGRNDVKAGAGSNSTFGHGSSAGISFSGLLNAIDGAASQEGRILIMTTNHKEKLDPALIRPGRADFHREICNASREQAVMMFRRFFSELNEVESVDLNSAAVEFGTRFPAGNDISMAMLQGFLQAFRGSDGMTKAIAQISQLGQGADVIVDHQMTAQDLTTYEYLRRAGLGHYAAGFEHFGFFQSSTLLAAKLDLAEIKKWYPEIMADDEVCRRMQQVLAADKSLTKAMSLVDKVAVKDIVLLHCASLRARHNKSRASFITASMACDSNEEYCASEDELPGGEALCRTRSSEAVAAEASATSIDRKLATAMVACLVGEGNCGRCSVWQLNQFLDAFLSLYQDGALVDMDKIVAAAERILLKPRPDSELVYCPLKAYEWLLRFGPALGESTNDASIATFGWQMEDAGYATLPQLLQKQPEVSEFREMGMTEAQASVIVAVNKWDEDEPELLRGMCLPDRQRVYHALKLAFPHQSSADSVNELTDKIAPDIYATVSVHQLEEFLQRYGDSVAAVANAQALEHQKAKETGSIGDQQSVSQEMESMSVSKQTESMSRAGSGSTVTRGVQSAQARVDEELLNIVRAPFVEPPEPPAPKPTYVASWLTKHKLGPLVQNFNMAGLNDEIDIGPPMFSDQQLEKLAPKLGDRRKLVRCLKQLHSAQFLDSASFMAAVLCMTTYMAIRGSRNK